MTKNSHASFAQNWFHKCYSKLVSATLRKIGPQTLFQIGFTNVAHANVYMHACMPVFMLCMCVAF